jgi:ankyrin repeat protein
MFAASLGKIDNMRHLVKNGAHINAPSTRGFTPLFFAIKSGVPGAAEAAIDLGCDPTYSAPDGTNALELALLRSDFRLATNLVQRGVNFNHWDINGRHPLHIAAANNEVVFARLLLDKGADPNVLTKQAYRVIRDGYRDRRSTWPDNNPTVKVVLRHRSDGAGPDAPPSARTALLVAAENGSLDTMKLLAASLAKPDFTAMDGTNVALASIASGDAAVIAYALELNPDVNAVTIDGENIMHLAVSAVLDADLHLAGPPGEEIIRLLADMGVKLDHKDGRGRTPYALVSRRGTENIQALYTLLLKEQGIGLIVDADPNDSE